MIKRYLAAYPFHRQQPKLETICTGTTHTSSQQKQHITTLDEQRQLHITTLSLPCQE